MAREHRRVGVGQPDADRERRPDGVSDATVRATGHLSEAVEYVHRARGALYEAHQLIGRADLLFEQAGELLDQAGHGELAQTVQTELVGRNVLPGRWTFQLVEEFDDNYYRFAVALEQRVRDQLLQGRRHVHESEMKQRRRSPGVAGHEERPADL